MKKFFICVVFSLFFITGAFAKDMTFTKKIVLKEIDSIEFVNCTRYQNIKGYVSSSLDKAVGFFLKETGDKYTASINDWKNLGMSFKVVLFDIDAQIDLMVHADGDNLYIAIVEAPQE